MCLGGTEACPPSVSTSILSGAPPFSVIARLEGTGSQCVRGRPTSGEREQRHAPGDLHAKLGVDALRALVKDKRERVGPVPVEEHLADVAGALRAADLCRMKGSTQRSAVRSDAASGGDLDAPSSKPKARMTVRSGEKSSAMSFWTAFMMPMSCGRKKNGRVSAHHSRAEPRLVCGRLTFWRTGACGKGVDKRQHKSSARRRARTNVLAVSAAAAVDPALLRELGQVALKGRVVPPADRVLVDGDDILLARESKGSAPGRTPCWTKRAGGPTWCAISRTGCRSSLVPFHVSSVPYWLTNSLWSVL